MFQFKNITGLYVVFKDTKEGDKIPVGRLDRVDNTYKFTYTEGYHRVSVTGLLPLHGFDDPLTDYVSNELFEFFNKRLIPNKSYGYRDYLTRLGLSVFENDPMVIMERSFGRHNDLFELRRNGFNREYGEEI